MCSLNHVQKFLSMESMDVTSDGIKFLHGQLSPFPGDQQRVWLPKIILALKGLKHHDGGRFKCSDVEQAIRDLSNQVRPDKLLNIIDAFDVPKFEYVVEKKKYLRVCDKENPRRLHGSAKSKSELYKERFDVVFKLHTVGDVLSLSHKLDKVIVLGMLTQNSNLEYCLEDHSGRVLLDLSNAVCNPGLLTENSIVLVEGSYEESLVIATALGLPPIEQATVSRSVMGEMNFFGGESAQSVKFNEVLGRKEREDPDATIVILSEVWLDDNQVLSNLDLLFGGFSDTPPIAFIFCGSFCSVLDHRQIEASKSDDGFRKLTKLMDKYKDLISQTQVIFVPSLQDVGVGTILPRPRLLEWLTKEIKTKHPTCQFTSNPCRIEYCSQEIVVFRQDLAEKLCRNCVKVPSTRKEISDQGSFSRSGGSFQVYLPGNPDKNEAIENSDVHAVES